MGQTLSSVAENGSDTRLQTTKIERRQLESAFIKQAISLFTPIELFSLKSKLNLNELVGSYQISRKLLFQLLDLPLDLPASDQIFKCLKFIALFPNFQHQQEDIDHDSISVYGLIKLISILDKDKYSKLFAAQQRIFLSMIFLSLASKKTIEDNEKHNEENEIKSTERKVATLPDQSDDLVDCVKVNGKIQWSLLPIVQSCDEFEISNHSIIASELNVFITFLLTIADITTGNKFVSPLTAYAENFKKWDKYSKASMNLIRSFDTSITSENVKTFKISFTLFERVIDTTVPFLFNPLHFFLQNFLYSSLPTSQLLSDIESSTEITNKKPYIFTETRILTNPMLSQLSTFLPSELVFSRLRKLYTGAEAGFSMRSMESKIFKWNAPSILLVSGKRVIESKPNKRYDAFKDTFPKFHKTSEIDTGDENNSIKPTIYKNDNDDSASITYGVYIKQPWKISNATAFGDSSFEIFQLSPRQQIFKGVSTSSPNNDYCYFSTNGGGIGFGSPPPKIKSNGDKIYHPGAVSLTIDQTIEFAVFRNLGIGGYYKSQSLSNEDTIMEYEDRFQITDLEVWGCGTEKELEEQQKRWEWENREAKARQQLNVKDGRALLEMAGIVGNHNASGGSV